MYHLINSLANKLQYLAVCLEARSFVAMANRELLQAGCVPMNRAEKRNTIALRIEHKLNRSLSDSVSYDLSDSSLLDLRMRAIMCADDSETRVEPISRLICNA